jgi:hypothetical protein
MKKSLHLLALQCGISRSTLHTATELLMLGPYKMAVVHSLLPQEFDTAGGFRNLCLMIFLTQNLRFIR